DNPVIGDRSFSRDPRRVARLGLALAQGLERSGVASCAKHFPGHGDTSQDSHLTLPRLAHDEKRLWEVELVPFVAAARAGIASVMTAHVRFETFDRLPATISPVALRLLRRDVGFRGCCISDDLEMRAISDIWGVPDAAELSITAGCDAVLVCHTLQHQHDAIDAIARGARAGPLPRERLAEAATRAEPAPPSRAFSSASSTRRRSLSLGSSVATNARVGSSRGWTPGGATSARYWPGAPRSTIASSGWAVSRRNGTASPPES